MNLTPAPVAPSTPSSDQDIEIIFLIDLNPVSWANFCQRASTTPSKSTGHLAEFLSYAIQVESLIYPNLKISYLLHNGEKLLWLNHFNLQRRFKKYSSSPHIFSTSQAVNALLMHDIQSLSKCSSTIGYTLPMALTSLFLYCQKRIKSSESIALFPYIFNLSSDHPAQFIPNLNALFSLLDLEIPIDLLSLSKVPSKIL